ncbi:MAG TPA: hypothetical protein VL129_04650 [Pseudomonas sp.]|jgi:hypothetical protein|uniref:hypothetical protein n=1 Tax=Pseudomonas sp. TaxID=306 RepID=UPI002D1A58E4|nr:hypothetical protein [Pseudomonas sp.]HTO18421.1 hypothetical protein [Pseudomonas sp.]
MFAELKNKELHLHGKTAEFNAIARSIHKGRHGASASFGLCSSISLFSSLHTKCHGKLAAIEIKESEIHITYSESVKNHLYTYFSMPSDTQPGSVFFLTHSSPGYPPLLADSSLDLIIHVISSET